MAKEATSVTSPTVLPGLFMRRNGSHRLPPDSSERSAVESASSLKEGSVPSLALRAGTPPPRAIVKPWPEASRVGEVFCERWAEYHRASPTSVRSYIDPRPETEPVRDSFTFSLGISTSAILSPSWLQFLLEHGDEGGASIHVISKKQRQGTFHITAKSPVDPK